MLFHSWVVYISSNFWLLAVRSRDLSQAEKEITACKAEQIHNMTTIFTSLVHFKLKNRLYNNIARYNLINTKYSQMVFLSPSDGAPISPNQQFFGIPGQTKVSGNRQWETTHEICWLAAK